MANALGFDISLWNDNNSTAQMVDFVKAKAAGISFAFIKASQANYLDPDFILNWSACKRAGVLRGCYHFFTWDIDPVVQAQFFAGATRADPPELDYIADYEWWGTIPTDALARLEKFLAEMDRLTGKPCGIYTAPAFWNQYGENVPAEWQHHPLWIANWLVTTPTLPPPWTTWKYWQQTSKGDGIKYGCESTYVDLDYFNGTVEQLYAYAGIPFSNLEDRVAKLETRVSVLEAKLKDSTSVTSTFFPWIQS